MERTIVFKRDGKKEAVRLTGFTDDPASDLTYYKRRELESLIRADKNSPIMIVVK
jgi:hypothetical protein